MHIWCGAFCVLQLNSSKIWQREKYRIIGLQKLLRDRNANVHYWRKADMSLRTAHVRFFRGKADMLSCTAHVRFWPKADTAIALKVRFRG